MITIHPLQLALWLAIAGVSFGVALSAGWLILLGVSSALLVLICAAFAPFMRD